MARALADSAASANRLRFEDVIDAHGGLRSDYERGYVDALLSVAYTTSERWAKTGVLYVGTTGCTLAEVVNEFLEARREATGMKP